MTPHEALSHAMTAHTGGPWRHWTAAPGRARVRVIYRAKANQYDLCLSYTGGGLTVGPIGDRWHSAREVLTALRDIAVDESADTTAIDHALTHLQEP